MFRFPAVFLLFGVLFTETTFGASLEEESPCQSGTCKNEGTFSMMVKDDSISFSCSCKGGWAGYRCDIRHACNWLGSKCSSDTDCELEMDDDEKTRQEQIAAQPICFKRRCLCPFDHFYSVSRRACVRHCKRSDLQPTFAMYPGSGIIGLNHYTFYNIGVERCKQACASLSSCENVEFNGQLCHGSRISPGQPGVNFRTDTPAWDHYQRNCA